MSRARADREVAATCFPRVSGDEPGASRVCIVTILFSPRERG